MYPTDKIYCTVKTFILITGQYKLKNLLLNLLLSIIIIIIIIIIILFSDMKVQSNLP